MEQSKRVLRKKLVLYLWLAVGVFFVIMAVYKWYAKMIFDGYAIFYISLIIAYLFNYLTWGNVDGPEGSDEMNEHIIRYSAKISYYVLIAILVVLIIAANGLTTNVKAENMPLWLALCAAVFVMPVVEFLVSRRYR
jgi:hypothetical protein